MTVYRKLLVALDGSSFSEQALGGAMAIAGRIKAKVEMVLVHTPHPLVVEFDPNLDPTVREEEERYLHTTASAVNHRVGVHPHVAVIDGSPATAICAYALEHDVDLIVMTTHGRTGFSRVWLGSVADGVVRHAEVPVLLLRAHETADARAASEPPAFGRILVPLDGSAAGASILPHALALGDPAETSWTLARIVPPVALPPIDMGIPGAASALVPDDEATQALVDGAKRYLSGLASTMCAGGARNVEIHVDVSLHTGPAIVALAQSKHVDVVAMTTHGRGASRLLMGSVADKVLRGTSCAVLLNRPKAAG